MLRLMLSLYHLATEVHAFFQENVCCMCLIAFPQQPDTFVHNLHYGNLISDVDSNVNHRIAQSTEVS